MSLAQQNIEELISGCRERNQKAQFEIYRRYSKAMYNVALRVVKDAHFAEDVMQEGFLKAFMKIDDYRREVAFGAWLKRIIINCSIDFFKKNSAFKSEDIENVMYKVDDGGDEMKSASDFNQLKAEQVLKAVGTLKNNYRVKINNKYGDVISGDLFSNVNVKCKYGKITLGKLNGGSNVLDIEYCSKSTVDYVKSGTISADYSGLTINEFEKIILKADYTDINFYKGENLKYDCSYGKLNFGRIGSIDGSGDYLTIKIDEIDNTFTINTKYSKLTVMTISGKAGDATINSAYTSIEAGYHANYAFDFNVALKYAAFKYGSDVEMNLKQEGNFAKNYQGFHKKSGINKMTINSEYGNVSLHRNN